MGSMDVVSATKMYINRMIDNAGPGMKVLLMDRDTTTIISMVFAQSEILLKEVYLFERIDKSSPDAMKHLKCIAFLRPSKENIEFLVQELSSPRYGQYFLYFSNIVNRNDIKRLAEADNQECVKEVHEYYADYISIAPHFFTLNIPGAFKGSSWKAEYLQHAVQRLTAVLLSLRKKPVIRYQASSDAAKLFAERALSEMCRESKLFDIRVNDDQPVLLILDRRCDCVTPLLTQWTYQAMVHDQLTIVNNRVNLSAVEGVAKELHDVVLSQDQDDFYAANMYKNFGEIGLNIKLLLDDFQRKSSSQQQLDSIADMKTFVETYPQFRKIQGTVAKHVTIVGELSRLVGAHDLLSLSEVEQEMAMGEEHANILGRIKSLIVQPKIRAQDALKLVMLYTLLYHKNPQNEVNHLTDVLQKQRGLTERDTMKIRWLLEYSRQYSRSIGSVDVLTKENVRAFTHKVIKGLKGVENIYTQHTSQLYKVLEDCIRGRLNDGAFPILSNGPMQSPQGTRVNDVIVFIIGGATYHESCAVHTLMEQNPQVRLLLGSTTCLNFQSFCDELQLAMHSTHIPSGAASKKLR